MGDPAAVVGDSSATATAGEHAESGFIDSTSFCYISDHVFRELQSNPHELRRRYEEKLQKLNSELSDLRSTVSTKFPTREVRAESAASARDSSATELGHAEWEEQLEKQRIAIAELQCLLENSRDRERRLTAALGHRGRAALLADLQAATRELEVSKRDAREALHQISGLQLVLSESRATAASRLAQCEEQAATIARLQNSISSLNSSRSSLECQLTSSQNEAAEKTAALEQEIARHKRRITQLEAELSSRDSSLAAVQLTSGKLRHRVDEQQIDIERMEMEKAEDKRILEDFQADFAKFRSLAEQETAAMQSELSEWKSAGEEALSKLQSEVNKRSSTELKLEMAVSESRRLELELAASIEKQNKLESERVKHRTLDSTWQDLSSDASNSLRRIPAEVRRAWREELDSGFREAYDAELNSLWRGAKAWQSHYEGVMKALDWLHQTMSSALNDDIAEVGEGASLDDGPPPSAFATVLPQTDLPPMSESRRAHQLTVLSRRPSSGARVRPIESSSGREIVSPNSVLVVQTAAEMITIACYRMEYFQDLLLRVKLQNFLMPPSGEVSENTELVTSHMGSLERAAFPQKDKQAALLVTLPRENEELQRMLESERLRAQSLEAQLIIAGAEIKTLHSAGSRDPQQWDPRGGASFIRPRDLADDGDKSVSFGTEVFFDTMALKDVNASSSSLTSRNNFGHGDTHQSMTLKQCAEIIHKKSDLEEKCAQQELQLVKMEAEVAMRRSYIDPTLFNGLKDQVALLQAQLPDVGLVASARKMASDREGAMQDAQKWRESFADAKAEAARDARAAAEEMTKLTAQIASLASQVVAGDTKASAAVAESARLTSELQKSQAQLQSTNNDLRARGQSLSALQMQLDTKKEEVEGMRQELVTLRQSREDDRSTRANAEEQVARLQQEMKTRQTQHTKDLLMQRTQTEEQLNSLRADHDLALKRADIAHQEAMDREAAKTEQLQITCEQLRLQAQLKASERESVDAMKTRLSECEAKIALLEDQIEHSTLYYEKALNAAKSHEDDLRRELDRANSKLQHILKLLKADGLSAYITIASEESLGQIEAESTTEGSEEAEALDAVTESTEQINALPRERSKDDHYFRLHEETLSAYRDLERSAKRMREEMDIERTKRVQAEADRDEARHAVTQLQAKVRAVECELVSQTTKASEASAKYDSAQSELAGVKAELLERAEAAEREVEKLRTTLEDGGAEDRKKLVTIELLYFRSRQEHQRDAQKLAATQVQLEALKATHEKTSKDLADLLEQSASLRKEVTDLAQRLEQTEAEREQTRTRVRGLQLLLSKALEENDVATSDGRNSGEEGEERNLRESHKLAQCLTLAHEELEAERVKVKVAERKAEALEKELIETQTALKRAKEEYEQLDAHVNAIQSGLPEAQATAQTLRGERDALKEQLEKAKEQVEGAAQEKQHILSRLRAVETELNEANEQKKKAMADVAILADVKAQLKNAEGRVASLTAKLNGVETELQSSTDNLRRLNAEKSTLEREVGEVSTKLQQLQREMKSQEEESQALQQEMQHLRQALRMVAGEPHAVRLPHIASLLLGKAHDQTLRASETQPAQAQVSTEQGASASLGTVPTSGMNSNPAAVEGEASQISGETAEARQAKRRRRSEDSVNPDA